MQRLGSLRLGGLSCSVEALTLIGCKRPGCKGQVWLQRKPQEVREGQVDGKYKKYISMTSELCDAPPRVREDDEA